MPKPLLSETPNSRRKRELVCASRRAHMLKKSLPASWPAKSHSGTIWVYRGEHPSLTHNFQQAFSPILKQADGTLFSLRSRRCPKHIGQHPP